MLSGPISGTPSAPRWSPPLDPQPQVNTEDTWVPLSPLPLRTLPRSSTLLQSGPASGLQQPGPRSGEVRTFTYNAGHQVVICKACESCIIPGERSIIRHLREQPHRLKGNELKEVTARLLTYRLRPESELQEYRPSEGGRPCPAIEGLPVFGGFRYIAEDGC